MLSITTCTAVLLGVVGIAIASPSKVKCLDYTNEANQKMATGWIMADPVAATTDKGGFVVTVPSGSKGVWVQVKGNTIADPGVGTIMEASSSSSSSSSTSTGTGTDEDCGGLWYDGTGSSALSQLTYEFAVDDPAVSYDVIVGYGAGYGKLQISLHTFISRTPRGGGDDVQVSGTTGDDGTVAAEYVKVQQLTESRGKIRDVALSPTGNVMATVSDASETIVYDTSTPGEYTMLQQLKDHTGFITGVAFSPSGNVMVTVSVDKKAIVYDSTTPGEYTKLQELQATNCVAFSPTGNVMVIGYRNNVVTPIVDVYDSSTPGEYTKLQYLYQRSTLPISGIAFSPSGNVMVTVSVDTKAIVYDSTTPGEYTKLQELEDHTSSVNGVAFSPSGNVMVTVSRDKTAIVYESSTPGKYTQLQQLRDHTHDVDDVAFSPSGNVMVTVSSGSTGTTTTIVYDSSTPGKYTPLQQLRDYTGVTGVAFSPSGNVMVTVHGSDAIVYEARCSDNINFYQSDVDPTSCLATTTTTTTTTTGTTTTSLLNLHADCDPRADLCNSAKQLVCLEHEYKCRYVTTTVTTPAPAQKESNLEKESTLGTATAKEDSAGGQESNLGTAPAQESSAGKQESNLGGIVGGALDEGNLSGIVGGALDGTLIKGGGSDEDESGGGGNIIDIIGVVLGVGAFLIAATALIWKLRKSDDKVKTILRFFGCSDNDPTAPAHLNLVVSRDIQLTGSRPSEHQSSL
eukprot:gene18542-1611_t